MAKKSDRISVNAIEKITKEKENIHTVNWNGLELKIKKFISFDEMRLFVASVAEACFSDVGEYRPEFRDFVTRAVALSLYTNISLPANLDKQYEIVYRSGAIDEIVQHIDPEQYKDIICAIDRKIEAALNTNIDALNKQRDELDKDMNKMRELFEDIDPRDIENMVSALSNLDITEEGLMQAFLNSKYSDEPRESHDEKGD